MRFTRLFVTLGPTDLKNMRRDAMLSWLPFLPLLLALVLRFGVPWLNDYLVEMLGFSLAPYTVLLMSFFMLMVPSMAGFVVGFMLIDERDDGTLLAMRVTPLSLRQYLLYRLAVPLVLGFATTLIGYPLTGLLPLSWPTLLAIMFLASFTGPIITLGMLLIATNKIASMGVMKGLNALSVLPIGAWFVAEPWQWLAGWLPFFWPMKVFWLAVAERPFALPYLLGLLINILVLGWLTRAFERKLYSA